MVESLFSKATETSASGNSVEKYVHGMFLIAAFLEIPRSPLLTGVAGLQYKICKATKNGKFQEVIPNGVPYHKLTDLETARFSLACF